MLSSIACSFFMSIALPCSAPPTVEPPGENSGGDYAVRMDGLHFFGTDQPGPVGVECGDKSKPVVSMKEIAQGRWQIEVFCQVAPVS
jgi:hypothetical protein